MRIGINLGIRLSTKKLIYSGVAGAALMLGITSVSGYFLYKNAQEKEIALINEYEDKLTELENAALQNQVAYSLNKDVAKGELITEDVLTKVFVPPSAVPEDIVELPDLKLKNEFILYAKTDLKANTVLADSMVYKNENITNDIREAEYGFIELPTNIAKDSYVDIRIQFPTGDDFVVLTKKRIKNIAGVTVWTDVGESEILTMSSAVVDAYIEGAKIYAIPYVDEHMQEKSVMTYPVKENVKELIEESPNVVNIAELYLEKQNRLRLENNLQNMGEDLKSQVEVGNRNTKALVKDSNAQLDEERLNEENERFKEQENLIGGE